MPEINKQRILALDVRAQSVAFVVFEGSGEILDWGARSFRRGVNAVRLPLRAKITLLIDQYVPHTVVVAYPKTARTRQLVRRIRECATERACAVRVVPSVAIEKLRAGRNKDEMARAITERYPELLLILPPRRKPWESEDYRMSILDAAVLGVAFFNRSQASTIPPNLPQYS